MTNAHGATTPEVRNLSDDELRGLKLSQTQIADAVEQAILDEAAGLIWTAPKSSLSPGPGRYMMSTLSASDTPAVSVIKVVTVSPDNPADGLPAINGTILLHDSQTGVLRAVMDAAWVTAVRTAGLSAAVARKLANPQARTLALLGAGVQARSHLAMFAELFPLTHVTIYGRGQANIDQLRQVATDHGLAVTVSRDPQDVIAPADLIVSSVTAATLQAPFLDASWIKPGAFLSSVDLGAPWRPETLNALDQIIIDDPKLEATGAKPMVAPELVTGHLAGVVTEPSAGHNPGTRAAFIFRGLAIGDFAVAALIWTHLQEQAGSD